MKKYKRTRIVASLAVISSLAFTSTTFGATTTPLGTAAKTKHPTHIGTQRAVRAHKAETPAHFRKELVRIQKSLRANGKTTNPDGMRHAFGVVTELTSDGFVISAGKSPVARTVRTNSNTVYMKNSNLDATVDVAVGQRVIVTGSVISDNIIEAKGVNIFIPN